MDERTYLKVKIKSLAEEAKIIRLETKRARKVSIKNGLALHRKGVVRFEARHTHLAYGFLRGLEYRQMEQKAFEAPDWAKVKRMIERYGLHREWEARSKTSQSVTKKPKRSKKNKWFVLTNGSSEHNKKNQQSLNCSVIPPRCKLDHKFSSSC